jgi:hypothetical protein
MSSAIFVSFSAIPKCASRVSSNVRSSVGAGTLLLTVRKFTWVLRNSRLEISGQADSKPETLNTTQKIDSQNQRKTREKERSVVGNPNLWTR